MPTQTTSTFCSSDRHRRLEDSLDVLLSVTQLAGGDKLDDDERAALSSALAEFRETAPHHMRDEEEFLFHALNSQETSCGYNSDELISLKATHELARRRHRGVEELFRTWLKEGELPPDDTRILLRLLKQLRTTFSRYLFPVSRYSGPPLVSNFLSLEGTRA